MPETKSVSENKVVQHKKAVPDKKVVPEKNLLEFKLYIIVAFIANAQYSSVF